MGKMGPLQQMQHLNSVRFQKGAIILRNLNTLHLWLLEKEMDKLEFSGGRR
jgi:hypothetical protein